MPEKCTTPYPVKRIHADSSTEDIEVLLARECPVKPFLDGKLFTTLFASPLELKELAVERLITEGALSFKEIAGIPLIATKTMPFDSSLKPQRKQIYAS